MPRARARAVQCARAPVRASRSAGGADGPPRSGRGDALRTDLVTVIEQAAQDTKEFFDSFSDIGQGIRRMTSMGKGMLLEFENVNSDAVKLFGQGAQGIATMIKETSSSIKAMGNYSEVFGSTIINSSPPNLAKISSFLIIFLMSAAISFKT